MELMEAIRKRRSIRRYKPDPVPEEKIRHVLEAARLAPSWANRQCWRYIIVTDEALKREITMRDWAAQAPVIIVGCADPRRSGTRADKQYYLLDMGISMEHLILAATEQGLGTCWIGGQFDEEAVKEALGIPEEIRVVALVSVGYPDEEPEPKTRKSLEEITSRNQW
ncbi:MAG: nitroreductase family protein [Candidatus Bathyarchaeia archaeon]